MTSQAEEARISWTRYFMEIARLTARRSPCLSRKVGAVLTSGNRVIAAGYNGPPSGIAHCVGECPRKAKGYASGEGTRLCRAIHAEQNAVISCASAGTAIRDAVLYCTCFPCSVCLKMILNLDIHTVIHDNRCHDPLSGELLRERGFMPFVADGFPGHTRAVKP